MQQKIALAIAFTLAMTSAATTHNGAMGPTLVRMNAMTKVQSALKQLKPALASHVANSSQINQAFDVLRALGDELPQLFEDEHMMAMSEASPTIWTEPDAFAKEIVFYNTQIETASNMVANDPNAVMKVIAKSCQSCHTKFRVK